MEDFKRNQNGIEMKRIIINNEDENSYSIVSCRICSLVPLYPVTCSECIQIFCSICINNPKLSNEENFQCPKCNLKFIENALNEKQIEIFEKIKVNCIYINQGCQQILKYHELKEHQNICGENSKECNRCGQIIAYKNFYTHIPNCKQIEIKCNDCEFIENKINYEKTEILISHLEHRLLSSVKSMFKEELNNIKKELIDYIDMNLTRNTNPNTEQFDIYKNLNKMCFRKDICSNADNNYDLDNRFCIFKTFHDDYLIVWGNSNYFIEVYDLILEKTNHLIKNAHTSNIICFSNCSDPIKKLTYLLSCSYDRSIKIWIPENKWENVINISDAHYDYSIFSAQIFYHIIKKEIFIISSNFNEKIIKIWDSNKNCIKAINESGVKFINWWYDSELEKYYLISVNNTEINSYEFLNIHIYTTFNPDDQSTPTSALVNKYGHLIESDSKGTIRVWDFHSAELISVIIRGSNKFKITGINLLDEEILLAASSDKFVLVYDLRENKFLKSFSSHNNEVFTVKSFYHPIHNKIFASYGFDCKIKLWY